MSAAKLFYVAALVFLAGRSDDVAVTLAYLTGAAALVCDQYAGTAVRRILRRVRVFVILDERTSREHPLGEAGDVLLTHEDAERFLTEVRGDDPELAKHLRIEERELDAGGRN